MRKKSYPFTLLEIVIALSLLGLVMGTLFFSLKQVLLKNAAGQALKQKILHLELFRKRLHDLLLEADRVYSEPSSGCISLLFLEEEEEESSLYRPHRMGFLYRKGNQIYLGWEKQEETLLDNVTEFTWKLCDRKGYWSSESSATSHPVLLILTVEIQKDPFSYAFFLDRPNDPIIYRGRTKI
ncbi:MAG: type II secretion system protein [Verrucomicrobia bacterium]|nr:type II secretion system protein [Verrucomicrobiota bacterium]